MRLRSQKSVTLMETMLAAAILAVAICGMLAAYLPATRLIIRSKNISIATSAAQGLMEEIRSWPYPQIITTYNNLNFVVNNLPGSQGVVVIDGIDPDFLLITITVSWREQGGAMINTPVQLVTRIANR